MRSLDQQAAPTLQQAWLPPPTPPHTATALHNLVAKDSPCSSASQPGSLIGL